MVVVKFHAIYKSSASTRLQARLLHELPMPLALQVLWRPSAREAGLGPKIIQLGQSQ